jgi:hypothetical protein
MYGHQISNDKILNMATEADRCLEPDTFEKGRALYDRNRVKWIKVFGPRIYSTVNDGKMHTVTIHIDNFPQSTCTCAKKRLCEHIAAVFMCYYDPWLKQSEILSKINTTKNKKASLEDAPLRMQNQAVHDAPDMKGPVEFWYKYFENTYRLVRESRKRPSQLYSDFFASELYFSARLYDEFIDVISVYSRNWPYLYSALYRFHSALFFMDMLQKQIKDVKPAYVDHYQMEEIWEDLMQSFDAILSSMQKEKSEPLFQVYWQKAMEVARERLFQVKTPLFDWLMLYRLLCVTSFNECLEKETLYLEGLIKKLKPGQQNSYYPVLGLASLRLAANREDNALSLLQQLKEKHVEDMFFYLEYFAGLQEWDKLLKWVSWLAPDIKGANVLVFKDICEYCLQAIENSKHGQEFVKLIRSWLPRSLDCYAEYLLEHDLLQEWVELNISYRGYTWDNIDKDVLRHIEAIDPAVLIPLYHQWAATLIEGKTRKSYQEAVRLLKKLRALYNKNKATREWQTFIYSLAARYPRMRALQEELRKGKLIS